MKLQKVGLAALLTLAMAASHWLALLAFSLVSCQNESMESSANLSVSSASLVTDGTAEVVVSNLVDTTNISWSIDPSETAKIIASGLKASIQFSNTGQYLLTVKQGVNIFSTVISVDSIPDCVRDSFHHSLDSLHQHHHDTIPPIHGDSLTHHHHGDTTTVIVVDSLEHHHHHHSGDSIISTVTDSLSHHHHHADSTTTISDTLYHHHQDSLSHRHHAALTVKRSNELQMASVFDDCEVSWIAFKMADAIEVKNEC